MKNNKLKISLLLFFFFNIYYINAQQAIITSGGNATGTGGKISYSIGQVADESQTGSTGSIYQGVQQAFEIFTLSGEEFTNIRLESILYPNPTTTNITLKITNMNLNKLNFQLFDIQGKIINEAKIDSENTILNIMSFPASIYFLKIESNNKVLKVFKIIKN